MSLIPPAAGCLLLLALTSLRAEEAGPFARAFKPYLKNHTLSGAVCLVATRDKILDEEAIGFADLEAKKPMRADAEFWIASDTKPMTATAFMMLVDEGKVSPDDTVEKYLPEFHGQLVRTTLGLGKVPSQHPMLIRELLDHTSGLPFASPIEHPTGDGVPLADRVRNYGGLVLLAQPGSQFIYSTAGFNTVGRIIEVVAGEPYEKFMQERLFTPLGMGETTFWPSGPLLEKVAVTYKTNGLGIGPTKIERLKYPLDGKDRYTMPGGGLFSTAADVLTFARMILDGGVYQGRRYLSEAALRTMTEQHTTKATGGTYAFGWDVGPGRISHNGSDSTRLYIDRKRGVIEIFLVQFAGSWPIGTPDMKNVFNETAAGIAAQVEEGK